MTTKTKGRDRWHGAPQRLTACRNFTASRIKALIVRLALWGLIPFGLSVWLIQRGGQQDD